MTHYSDEDVIAYVDGRLDGPALEAFEAKLSSDPALAQRVAGHEWLTRQIVAAYGTPPSDEIDAALLDRLGLAGQLAATDPVMADFAQHRRRFALRRTTVVVWTGALAASLVLGIFVGRPGPAPEAAMHMDASGVLAAGPALATALDQQLSGQGGTAIRIGLSFRSKDGICRSFVMPGGTSGLGCRQDGHWVVPVVAKPGADAATGGDYRLAGGDVAPVVMAEVDRRIVGEPLGIEGEIAARSKNWR